MRNDITLIMIKPDAVASGYTGDIIKRIEQEKFVIIAMKKMFLTKREAEKFYEVHKERPFFGELTEFMSSGPIVAAVLQRENAVSHWREVIGATDPKEAKENTIRKLFAKSKGENAVHGSDSEENANLEAAFFFSELDRI